MLVVLDGIITFFGRYATQYLLAILLFAPVLKKRDHFWWRLAIGGSVYTLFPYAVTGFGYYSIYHNPYLFIGWLDLNWMAVFLVGLIFTLVCFKITVFDAIFYCSSAYAMQHCARKISDVLETLFDQGEWARKITLVLVGFACFAAFYFIFVRKIEKNDELRIKNLQIVILSIVTLLVVYVLSVFVWQEGEQTNYSGNFYAIVCSILLLTTQFGVFTRTKNEYEKRETENMLHKQQELYRVSMENAAVINMKCHDLKKQIAMIRKMSDAEQREGSLKQVEKAILIYDGIAKTKNDTVNLIVSEKSMLCEKYGISFSYILKVDHLDKLNELDLYSLLGNALDNAIEEEVKIGEREKRIISLKTEMKDGNIQIHVENYIESRPIFKDGLPVTTKENKQWHGYGMKSIKYIAEKYHGTIDISVEDNMFNLDISIPAA